MCNAGYRDASRLGRVLSGAAGAGSTRRRRNNLDIYPGLLVFSAERRAPSAQGARATLVTRYPREPWEPPGAEPVGCLVFRCRGVVGRSTVREDVR
jgi:hypothetical protein